MEFPSIECTIIESKSLIISLLRPTDQQLKEAVESFDARTGYLESDIDQPAEEQASSSAAPAPKARGRGRGKAAPKAPAKPMAKRRGRGRG